LELHLEPMLLQIILAKKKTTAYLLQLVAYNLQRTWLRVALTLRNRCLDFTTGCYAIILKLNSLLISRTLVIHSNKRLGRIWLLCYRMRKPWLNSMIKLLLQCLDIKAFKIIMIGLNAETKLAISEFLLLS
jgi:hypothetical protein